SRPMASRYRRRSSWLSDSVSRRPSSSISCRARSIRSLNFEAWARIRWSRNGSRVAGVARSPWPVVATRVRPVVSLTRSIGIPLSRLLPEPVDGREDRLGGRHPRLHPPDNAVLVHQDDRPLDEPQRVQHAVGPRHLLPLIRADREAKPHLLRPPLVRGQAGGVDRHHLHVAGGVLRGRVTRGRQLPVSSRGVVLRVEDDENALPPPQRG